MPEQKPGQSGRPHRVLTWSWNTVRTHAGTAIRKELHECKPRESVHVQLPAKWAWNSKISKTYSLFCLSVARAEQQKISLSTFVACEQHSPLLKETTTKIHCQTSGHKWGTNDYLRMSHCYSGSSQHFTVQSTPLHNSCPHLRNPRELIQQRLLLVCFPHYIQEAWEPS